MHTSHMGKSVLLGFLLAMPVLFNSTFPKSKLQVVFFFNFPLLYQIFNWFSTPFCLFLFLRILILNSEQKHTRDRFLPSHIYIHFYSYSQDLYQRFESNGLPFSLMFSSFLILYSEHAIYLP